MLTHRTDYKSTASSPLYLFILKGRRFGIGVFRFPPLVTVDLTSATPVCTQSMRVTRKQAMNGWRLEEEALEAGSCNVSCFNHKTSIDEIKREFLIEKWIDNIDASLTQRKNSRVNSKASSASQFGVLTDRMHSDERKRKD
ncbi:hypothetical protein PRIPAC_71548 [Pristionchus pacificus]|uniref:Uncharacterized protein n=1 Tax=Pristionchus pacificus TaxID=54126 RepID=A0A2A6C1L7_PRIPA|nr:hypothetical protein PRIPAC_71548 [Pristionchus pacificus]|eukprot:PDM72064.1 hypothetical protein PRIPAC_38471 [Pristionchus pacificus]